MNFWRPAQHFHSKDTDEQAARKPKKPSKTIQQKTERYDALEPFPVSVRQRAKAIFQHCLPGLEIDQIAHGTREGVHHGDETKAITSKEMCRHPDMEEAQGRIHDTSSKQHTNIAHDASDTGHFREL
ncbi:hypothetical protein AA0229_2706 [Gluconobacter cerinus NRIC 0229]|nr:hypothetical protein AA0229_2706 [Gluconobacter cerinus NRIC 0229]